MNAYDYLITGQTADSRSGDMAVGHLQQALTTSPFSRAVETAGPWPERWRRVGCAVITPDGTLLRLTRDDSAVDVRGAEFSFTLVRVRQAPLEGLDGPAAYHLTQVGIPALRAAIWLLLEEWGTDQDRMDRAALLL